MRLTAEGAGGNGGTEKTGKRGGRGKRWEWSKKKKKSRTPPKERSARIPGMQETIHSRYYVTAGVRLSGEYCRPRDFCFCLSQVGDPEGLKKEALFKAFQGLQGVFCFFRGFQVLSGAFQVSGRSDWSRREQPPHPDAWTPQPQEHEQEHELFWESGVWERPQPQDSVEIPQETSFMAQCLHETH